MKKSVTLLILFALCCVFSAGLYAQGAQMYKWTDENGVVHFSETPRDDGKPAQVSEIPDNTVPTSGIEDSTLPATSNTAQQRRDDLAAKREEAKEAAREMETYCATSRKIVEDLEPHRRVLYKNEAGETVRMDDEDRVRRVAEAKKFLAENCK